MPVVTVNFRTRTVSASFVPAPSASSAKDMALAPKMALEAESGELLQLVAGAGSRPRMERERADVTSRHAVLPEHVHGVVVTARREAGRGEERRAHVLTDGTLGEVAGVRLGGHVDVAVQVVLALQPTKGVRVEQDVVPGTGDRCHVARFEDGEGVEQDRCGQRAARVTRRGHSREGRAPDRVEGLRGEPRDLVGGDRLQVVGRLKLGDVGDDRPRADLRHGPVHGVDTEFQRGRGHAFGQGVGDRGVVEVRVRRRAEGEVLTALTDDDGRGDCALRHGDEPGAEGGDHFFEDVVVDGGAETGRVGSEAVGVGHVSVFLKLGIALGDQVGQPMPVPVRSRPA